MLANEYKNAYSLVIFSIIASLSLNKSRNEKLYSEAVLSASNLIYIL